MKEINYNDSDEVISYVWNHFQHLMSDLERRTGLAIIGRQKADAAKRAKSPTLAKILDLDWGLTRDSQVNEALKEGPAVFRQRVCERLLATQASALQINRCPQCSRVVRTPKAKQCFWCGHDWHQ
jgi:hypothetical protein